MARYYSCILLPDGTLVCEFGYSNQYTFTRWDSNHKKILATSAKFEVINFYVHKSRIFPLSNHRVLSVFVNHRDEILVNEWDYETNTLLKQAKCIDDDIVDIISVHALENDRFLIKSKTKINTEYTGRYFTMYDANHGTSIQFNVVCRGIELADMLRCLNYHFLEEKGRYQLSFVTEYGFYVQGSWKKMLQYLDSNREAWKGRRYYVSLEVQLILAKSIPIELNLDESILNSVQILSNGDMLFTDNARNIWSIDQSKEPNVRTNYQAVEYNVDGLMELKNGLIFGKNFDHYVIFIWNRKGELLSKEYMTGVHDRVSETDSGYLISVGPSTFTKLRLIYSEENLANRCCNTFARFVRGETHNAAKNKGLAESIKVEKDYLEHTNTVLPQELCQCIRFFVGKIRQNENKQRKLC